jgi:hypothetical protein
MGVGGSLVRRWEKVRVQGRKLGRRSVDGQWEDLGVDGQSCDAGKQDGSHACSLSPPPIDVTLSALAYMLVGSQAQEQHASCASVSCHKLEQAKAVVSIIHDIIRKRKSTLLFGAS